MDTLSALLADQHGVVARRQLLDCDLTPADLARMVRRRELSRVHPGVYVDHTGALTWIQRAWAAVLFSWPAALSHDSALRAVNGPGRRTDDDTVIHVAVARGRRLVAPDGVRLHHVVDLDAQVQWNTAPPRVRFEHAVLAVAGAAATDVGAIAQLADACGSRRSTASRLRAALDDRPRQARRAWLASVLDDVATGTCSVLEHGYLHQVERAHGLPAGRRQSSHRHAGVVDRDLDGAAADDTVTIRLSWGQVFDRPCRTAHRLATVLNRRGWTGQLRQCPTCR